MDYQAIHQQLTELSDPDRAEKSARYFKTGKGEYAEGDLFMGVSVPELRSLTSHLIRAFQALDLSSVQKLECILPLLHSRYHEERLLALLILVKWFSRAREPFQREIYCFYLENTAWINNWDLVDSSAYHIVGPYLSQRDKSVLHSLAESSSLWERRIAVMSTFHFIRQNDFQYTLELCERLLTDREDLIHKATGWMLREIGKRDIQTEKNFLDQHCLAMPRTMLRYAIEKFPAEERKYYLNQR